MQSKGGVCEGNSLPSFQIGHTCKVRFTCPPYHRWTWGGGNFYWPPSDLRRWRNPPPPFGPGPIFPPVFIEICPLCQNGISLIPSMPLRAKLPFWIVNMFMVKKNLRATLILRCFGRTATLPPSDQSWWLPSIIKFYDPLQPKPVSTYAPYFLGYRSHNGSAWQSMNVSHFGNRSLNLLIERTTL